MDKPAHDLKIPAIVAPPVQGAENEPEGNLKIPAIVAPPIQGAENEPEGNLKIPAIVSPPVQGAENEPDTDFTIPLIELKESPLTEDEPHKTIAHLFSEGQWIPSADPLTIGHPNFSAMQNLRFAERNLEGVPGYTKINVTTALAAYLKIRAGIQLQTPFTTKSRVLAQAYNAALTGSQILQNKTAIPSQGDFEAAVLHTDAAGAGPGRFAKWPRNHIAYCNGLESKIYGGDEIPCAAFLNFDSANTFLYDYTDIISGASPSNAVTLSGDSGEGGGGADVVLLLHFDNDVEDASPSMAAVFETGTTEPIVGDVIRDTETGVLGTVTGVGIDDGSFGAGTAAGTITTGGYVSPGALPYNVIPWTPIVPYAYARTWYLIFAETSVFKGYYKGICGESCPVYVRPGEWPPYPGCEYEV